MAQRTVMNSKSYRFILLLIHLSATAVLSSSNQVRSLRCMHMHVG